MQIDLKNDIRKALAGSSSQQPVDATSLSRLGNKPDIDAALEQLRATSEINVAQTFKEGKWMTKYWLTGLTNTNRVTPHFAPSAPPDMRTQPSVPKPRPQPEPRKPAAPPQPTKEQKAMNQNKSKSPLVESISVEVSRNPGIGKDTLIKRVAKASPDHTGEQIAKAVANMINVSKKLRTEGPRGNKKHFLVTAPQQKPAKSESAPISAPAVTKAAKAKAPPAKRASGEQHFTLMISDDNHLHIGMGDEMYHLTPEQTMRLHAFMTRVHINGAPA